MSSGVYVSSTFTDLAEHREAVKVVIPTLASAEDFAEFQYIGLEYRITDERPSIESLYSAIDDAEYVEIRGTGEISRGLIKPQIASQECKKPHLVNNKFVEENL